MYSMAVPCHYDKLLNFLTPEIETLDFLVYLCKTHTTIYMEESRMCRPNATPGP